MIEAYSSSKRDSNSYKFADRLIVQIPLTVTFEKRHRHLIHRIIDSFFRMGYIILQVVNQPFGSEIGTFIKTFHLVAFYLQFRFLSTTEKVAVSSP